MPRVSVIIPNHNRANLVTQAVKSVQAQTYTDWEMILVDDASTDGSATVLAPLTAQNPRIRIITLPENRGAGGARNAGVQAATGEYVAFLDSDDLWLPDHLERLIASDADLVVSDCWFEDGQGQRRLRALPALTAGVIRAGQGINPGSALMARKSVFDTTGAFDERLRRLEDWDWLLRALEHNIVPKRVPHATGVIRVGAPPSPEAVDAAAFLIRARHKGADIHAASYLESAAAWLWQGNVSGFATDWLKAFTIHPALTLGFVGKRLMRAIKGDAPRVFRLFNT